MCTKNVGKINWKDSDSYTHPFSACSDIENSLFEFINLHNLNQVNYFLNDNERLLDLIFINEDFIFNISVPDYPLFQKSLHHLPILFEAGSLNFSNSCSLVSFLILKTQITPV